ncbi:MAG TPA: SPOR domain-containing protein [Ignavibacteriaceae bacterium]|nr:SPOR domain-containing protein [Ignavibacteriaceae bacterium]
MIFSRRLKVPILLLSLFLPFLIYSCGASSTVRYEREKKNEKKGIEEKTFKETFDITPYKTTIDIKEKPVTEETDSEINAWYGYEQKDSTSDPVKTVVGTTNGFRVQVFATDNLEQADSLKSELVQKVIMKNIYIIFDPPFYKVEVGDFTSMGDAKDLNFKLTQMGYTESRVISSTVNVYE